MYVLYYTGGGHLCLKRDPKGAYIYRSEKEEKYFIHVEYGESHCDYDDIPIKDELTGKGILRGATLSGVLDFTTNN